MLNKLKAAFAKEGEAIAAARKAVKIFKAKWAIEKEWEKARFKLQKKINRILAPEAEPSLDTLWGLLPEYNMRQQGCETARAARFEALAVCESAWGAASEAESARMRVELAMCRMPCCRAFVEQLAV